MQRFIIYGLDIKEVIYRDSMRSLGTYLREMLTGVESMGFEVK